MAALEWSEWSAPVKLGPPISLSRVRDGNAILSPDGLSLYFDSERADLPGAQGAVDMFVSRRACTDARESDCAWQTPLNMGPLFNTPYVEGGPVMSVDGHLLFFLSHKTRPDCPAEENEPDPTRPCDADVFVSWRSNPSDDLGWGPPVPLPYPVNTSDEDNVEAFVSVGEAGRGNLYFDRVPTGTAQFDMHYVPIRVTARGASSGPTVQVLGPVVALDEINLANTLDLLGSVRQDGREMFFTATAAARPGGLGALDILTSTRRRPNDLWAPPTNVTELNSIRADVSPKLSHDGRTLLFTSNREMHNPPCVAAGLPGNCGWDIYVSTRTRLPQ
ncbi:MAG: hypothetical protein ACREOK_02030 [Gemmatimonadaceae bacterium]